MSAVHLQDYHNFIFLSGKTMNKLDTAIDMLDKYRSVASLFGGYASGSCVLTEVELNTIVSLLNDARAELTLDIIRVP